MISLDQILLLEQRVESAVAKIAQLQAENDALRRKCSELTNALSSKSEQLSTFESDQNKIESGILKALDRLNSIENSILKASGQAASFQPAQTETAQVSAPASVAHEQIQQAEVHSEPKEPALAPETSIQPEQTVQPAVQFNTMQPVQNIQQPQAEEQNNSDFFAQQPASEDENGQFDIF